MSGYWSSGYPFLGLQDKAGEEPWMAGLQLPLFSADVSAIKALLSSLGDEAWRYDHQAVHNAVMAGRHDVMERFKPGVESIVLIFSDRDANEVYEFPFYSRMAHALEPLLVEVLGSADVGNIIRLQLARMMPGTSDIKLHQDTGGYATWAHRIHVPIETNNDVMFEVCPPGPEGWPPAAGGALAAVNRAAAGGPAAPAGGAHGALPAAAAAVRLPLPLSPTAAGGSTAPARLLAAAGSGTGAPGTATAAPPDGASAGAAAGSGKAPHAVAGQGRAPETSPPDGIAAAGRALPAGREGDGAGAPAAPWTPGREPRPARPRPAGAPAPVVPPARHPPQAVRPQGEEGPPRGGGCLVVEAPEGLVFELNNRVPHRVSNLGASQRIHLVVDVAEEPKARARLEPGAVCRYGARSMECGAPRPAA